jgi:hypothetical protein
VHHSDREGRTQCAVTKWSPGQFRDKVVTGTVSNAQQPRARCRAKHRLRQNCAICCDKWSLRIVLRIERRIPKQVQLRDKDGTRCYLLYEDASAQGRWDVPAVKLQLPRATIPPVTSVSVLAYSCHSWNDKVQHYSKNDRRVGCVNRKNGMFTCLTVG